MLSSHQRDAFRVPLGGATRNLPALHSSSSSRRRRQPGYGKRTSENANLAAGNWPCRRRKLADPAAAAHVPVDTLPGAIYPPDTAPLEEPFREKSRFVPTHVAGKVPSDRCLPGIVPRRRCERDKTGFHVGTVLFRRCLQDTTPAGIHLLDRRPLDRVPGPDIGHLAG